MNLKRLIVIALTLTIGAAFSFVQPQNSFAQSSSTTEVKDISCTVGQTIEVAGITIMGIEAVGLSNVTVTTTLYASPYYTHISITSINRTDGLPRVTAMGVTIDPLNVYATQTNDLTVRHDFNGSVNYYIGGDWGVSIGSSPFSDQCSAYA